MGLELEKHDALRPKILHSLFFFFPMAVKSSSLCACGSNYDLLVCLSVLKNPSFSESYLNILAVFPEMGLLIQEGPLSKTYF